MDEGTVGKGKHGHLTYSVECAVNVSYVELSSV